MNTSTQMTSNKPFPVKAQVLSLHISGKSNTHISRELGISKNTVTKILNESEMGKSTSIDKVLSNVGLTPETVAKRYTELMRSEETKLATWEGKFTDKVTVPDNTNSLNATRDVAKMLGMLGEDTVNMAQLLVKLPSGVLTKGHREGCTCPECSLAWESQAITVSPVLP